jgi:hypothetical protein
VPREEEKLDMGKDAAVQKSRLERLRQEDEVWEVDFQLCPSLYQFKITLCDIQLPIWRRIQVNNRTLAGCQIPQRIEAPTPRP